MRKLTVAISGEAWAICREFPINIIPPAGKPIMVVSAMLVYPGGPNPPPGMPQFALSYDASDPQQVFAVAPTGNEWQQGTAFPFAVIPHDPAVNVLDTKAGVYLTATGKIPPMGQGMPDMVMTILFDYAE